MKYIGPRYKKGLVIGKDTYKPKEFSDKQRESFLKKFPQYKNWWEKEDEKTENTSTSSLASSIDLGSGNSSNNKKT